MDCKVGNWIVFSSIRVQGLDEKKRINVFISINIYTYFISFSFHFIGMHRFISVSQNAIALYLGFFLKDEKM